MTEEFRISNTFPVKPKRKPKSKTSTTTLESKYWKSFKATPIRNLISSVTSISFSPIKPHDFASTFSASLALFDSKTLEPKSKITSFTDVAYSASFRADGKLIAAGGKSGLIQIFDPKKRNALRKLHGHTLPVHVVSYPRVDGLHLFSGGDDSLVKYWDVVSETKLSEFQGHKDHIRCGSVSGSDIFATGSHDHTVKLWDVRVSGSCIQLSPGDKVESVCFLPSGGLIATGSGNSVKVWDVIGGGRLVYEMESHNKTVTSICVGKFNEESRFLSVGLDGYMKVFDFSKMKITHSMKFPAPLMSIGFSQDCSTRAIGTSNGIIFAGKRKVGKNEDLEVVDFMPGTVEKRNRNPLRPSNHRYFSRGQNEKPSEGAYLVMKTKKVKVSEHDRLLRKFRHKEALVSVLNKKNPRNIVAVMEELVARNRLLKCVVNMEKEEVCLLLKFLQKYLIEPRFSSLLLGLVKIVIERRIEDIRTDGRMMGIVRNLKRDVEEEIKIQQALLEIQGIVSPLLRICGKK